MLYFLVKPARVCHAWGSKRTGPCLQENPWRSFAAADHEAVAHFAAVQGNRPPRISSRSNPSLPMMPPSTSTSDNSPSSSMGAGMAPAAARQARFVGGSATPNRVDVLSPEEAQRRRQAILDQVRRLPGRPIENRPGPMKERRLQAARVLEKDQQTVEQLTDDVRDARHTVLDLASQLDTAHDTYKAHYEALKLDQVRHLPGRPVENLSGATEEERQQAARVLQRDQQTVEQLTEDVRDARFAVVDLANQLDTAYNAYKAHYEVLKSLEE